MQPTIQTNSVTVRVIVPERPLLVNNVARLTGMCESAIRWNVRKGFLKAFKDPDTPKIWRFWRQDVEAFMARRRHAQAN